MGLNTPSFLHWKSRQIYFWIGIICCALGSGFVGGFLFEKVFGKSSTSPETQPLIFQDRQRGSEHAVPPAQDTIDTVSSSMLALFDDAGHAQGSAVPRDFPLGQSFKGYALALTTDGWLVTTASLDKSPKSLRAILKTGDWYAVDTLVPDPAIGVTFLKISAKNLRPIQFVKPADTQRAREAFIISGLQSVEHSIASPAWYQTPLNSSALLHSSANIDKRIFPDQHYSLSCLPLVSDSDSQEVIGCTSSRGIVSFAYLQQPLQALLRTGRIEQLAVNIHYYDLAQAVNPATESPRVRNGAYIQFIQQSRHGIGSDGTKNQLAPGDIITHVNDNVLDQSRNLSEALAEYKKGDAVILKVRSKGIDKNIHIKL